MKPDLICPTCGSDAVLKTGTTRRVQQNYQCRVRLWRGEALCGRQFVEDPQWKPIDPDHTATIDRLLLEKIPLAGIARVMKLSKDWLQRYVNRCDQAVPQVVQVQPKAKGRLAGQMDAWGSFVDTKGNKQWVWLAMDVATGEIVGGYIGDRAQASATAWWESVGVNARGVPPMCKGV